MNKNQNKGVSEQEGISRQYRDWLIPSTLLSGMSFSLVVYALSRDNLPIILAISASIGIVSVLSFLITVFYSISRLEQIEIRDINVSEDEGTLFIFPILGACFFLLAMILVCFYLNIMLGFIVSIIVALFIIIFFKVVGPVAK